MAKANSSHMMVAKVTQGQPIPHCAMASLKHELVHRGGRMDFNAPVLYDEMLWYVVGQHWYSLYGFSSCVATSGRKLWSLVATSQNQFGF